jgi:hypothetical protein
MSSNIFAANVYYAGNVIVSQTLNVGAITSTAAATFSVTPAAAANVLTVIGSSTTGNVFQFSNSAGGNFIMTNAGRIGIGTTSPAYLLDMSGGDIRVQNGGNVGGAGGSINFGANVGYGPMSQIKGALDTAAGSVNDQGSVVFLTRPQEVNPYTVRTNLTERMRVTSAGNVGIGTTDPETKLLVKDGEITSNSASTSGQFRAVSGNYGFFIRNDGTDSYLMHTASGNPYGSYNANRPFRINNASALVTMGHGLSISGGSGYTLDVSGDINASSTLRIGGLTQPRLISSGTFTGVTSFDTVTFDLVNYNIAEIRMTVYFNTTNQRIMSSQLLDTGGTVYSATESGWQMFYGTGGVAASGSGAYILNNTETANNGVGGFIVVIRLIGNMGISGSVRNHWEWTTTGCYAGIGASTTYGRAAAYNTSGVTINRMRFNLSGGTMTGKYSIINYST